MSATLSSVPDDAIFAAARSTFPFARHFAIASWTVAGERGCKWALWTCNGRNPRNSKWQVALSAWSRSELMLALRSRRPKRYLRVAMEPDETPGRHLV
jgi:hypothetical protein